MAYEEYTVSVQKAIEYIEDHLMEDISLEQIATHSSFSMYHFHRIFQAVTGMTVADYVRKRRLTNAAYELVNTDKRILEIAVEYGFLTQESFTRAFKKMFYMPPGRYRAYLMRLVDGTVENKGGSDMTATNLPQGWIESGSHPFDYTMGVDHKNVHQGTASGYIRSNKREASGFATMMQKFKAENYKGRRLRLSGFVKTEGVEQWAGLWMRVDGKDNELLQFDNMYNRPIKGTTNWNHYSVVLDVPSDSIAIAFGLLLGGPGQVWVDSISFDIVDEKVPSTNMEEDIQLPEQPLNLQFEE
ncbi:transcriptional regulator [Aneurinibacillus migulanus]|uniref:helix-turn-helix transcriptional regulator n=1 Tax=Aneurinibacillus migulanus TaxID=47500 RepID=UPI0005BE8DDA|nr:AraC family transcriptional regulator [Aneurinibacillus migulanus]KIV57645.1 transcriptional regulator [Aneurinibacillus migulanus]KPD05483.1 transcriptional regulator [Aneurinibacillus migulanus]MCP1357636.1 AraC family transcriptional regulator [Aneurinibacillus migulanus]MED4729883.1 AraC family transcriptional regulator [Aneurinibacillus migulanus]CEH28636.1 Transcriptional regulator, AraC family [Aneurinibacillus migulanus]